MQSRLLPKDKMTVDFKLYLEGTIVNKNTENIQSQKRGCLKR